METEAGCTMKHKKTVGVLVSLVLVVLCFGASVPAAFANSAEPPGLIIDVSSPPADLTISLRLADADDSSTVELAKDLTARGARFHYYYWMAKSPFRSFEGAVLIVSYGEVSSEVPLPSSELSTYSNYMTLNLNDLSLVVNHPKDYSLVRIILRILLTLVIEGLIFFAFGYRRKASWITFVVVNLITQGALNLLISGSEAGPYWLLVYLLAEAVIFIVEMIAFALILKEHKRSKAVVYALVANLASLVLGGLLITLLPV